MFHLQLLLLTIFLRLRLMGKQRVQCVPPPIESIGLTRLRRVVGFQGLIQI